VSHAPAAAGEEAPAVLAIDETQQAALLSELEVLLASVTDRAARAPFVDLVSEVAEGSVWPETTATLEKLLEMSLQTGRARRVHGPEAEQALLRLFHKTPRGAAAKSTTEAVNQALRGLAGQTLEEVLFTVQGPGVFKIGLRTDQCRLALEVDRHGVTVESLEV
jgi:hypothetical protein